MNICKVVLELLGEMDGVFDALEVDEVKTERVAVFPAQEKFAGVFVPVENIEVTKESLLCIGAEDGGEFEAVIFKAIALDVSADKFVAAFFDGYEPFAVGRELGEAKLFVARSVVNLWLIREEANPLDASEETGVDCSKPPFSLKEKPIAMSMSTKTIATTETLIKMFVAITRMLRIFFCLARSILYIYYITENAYA